VIVRFFRRGRGGGSGPADYLMGKNRDREFASVIRGDLEQTVENINGLNFARNYTSGCLSFAEKDISDKTKNVIMDSFESTVFAGLERDQYDITWIQHMDKGRLELNFLIPNVELQSGKRYQPYFHKGENKMMNAWQQLFNDAGGFKDPHDPKNKSILTQARDLPRDKKQAVESITGTLTNMAKNGLVKNRDEITAALENAGFEIARQTPKSISIKSPQGGQNIRLKGAIYDSSFRASTELGDELEAANRAYKAGREQRIQEFKQIYQYGSSKKRERNEKRYSRAESATLEPVQGNQASAIDRVLADRSAGRNGASSELGLGLASPGRDQYRKYLGREIKRELEKNDRARTTIAAITQAATNRLRDAVQRTTRVFEQLSERYKTEATKTHYRATERTRERENMPRL
tara:strand:- start:743 stop:1960 length:1218 start_codon:yes stop_codon:yes gene_type:complete